MSTHHLHARLSTVRLCLIALALAGLSALLCAAVAGATTAPRHARQGMIMEADPQSPCVGRGANVQSFLQEHDATVLRIVLPDYPSPGALRCVQRAYAQGYRVYLALQYQDVWSPARVASYYAQTLPAYAPYVWAITVGNEQDIISPRQHLDQGGHPRLARVCTDKGRRRHCERTIGAYYREVWNATEPVIARIAPKALRVYGETSPWGFAFLKQSFVTGQPRGAQAIGFHCYDTQWGGLRVVPRVAAWAGRHHLPLWCSEMGVGIHPPPWMRHDTPLQWEALVGSVIRRSPDLKMVSYYLWPSIGDR